LSGVDFEQMSGRELAYALKNGERGRDDVQCQIRVECFRVELASDLGPRQQRLELAAEQQSVGQQAVVERLDADTVPRHDPARS
jgi:hypothetical protein